MSRCEVYVRSASEIVDDSVTLLRNRGYTRQTAARECAAWLGTTARRVQALLFGEPVRVDAEEYAELRANYIRLLDDEAQDLERRAAKMRMKLQELRGTQDAEIPTSLLAGGGGTVSHRG
jgi:hypothetical protein